MTAAPVLTGGPIEGYIIYRDITQRKRDEALLAGEKRLLEMIAKGEPLPEMLVPSPTRVRACSSNTPTAASVPAAAESVLRAHRMAVTPPCGPVYICLDAGFQESRLDKEPEWPDVKRFKPPRPPDAVARRRTR